MSTSVPLLSNHRTFLLPLPEPPGSFLFMADCWNRRDLRAHVQHRPGAESLDDLSLDKERPAGLHACHDMVPADENNSAAVPGNDVCFPGRNERRHHTSEG
jgi:hypothetical protein